MLQAEGDLEIRPPRLSLLVVDDQRRKEKASFVLPNYIGYSS